MKHSNRKFLLIVLVPSFLEVFIFLIFPILGTGAISFMDYNPLQTQNRFVLFDNYKTLIHDEYFWIALKNTLVFTVVTVTLNILTALALSTMITQLRSNKSRSFFRMIVFLPCIAPMVASSVVWSRSLYATNLSLIHI